MNKELEKYLHLIKKNNVIKLNPNNISLGGFYLYLDIIAHKHSAYLLTPARVQWEITQQCNLFCKQCYINSSHFCRKNELSTSDCLVLIEKLKKLNILWIELQGGEPLIRKDFLIIINKIKKENLNVKIATNGTLITEKIAMQLSNLLNPKTDSIQISLDGSNSKINDQIRGNGAFKKTINGIRICKNIGLKYSINTTLMNENISDIFNIYKLIHKIGGADKFSFFTLMKVGRGKHQNFEFLEEGIRQYNKIKDFEKKVKKPSVIGYLGYEKHLPEYGKIADKVFANNLPQVRNRNSAAISSMDIDCDGSVYPSSFLQLAELNAGNIKSKSLNQLWNTSKWKTLREDSNKISGKCLICNLYKFCGGGTLTNLYLYSKNHCFSDPQCLYTPVVKIDGVNLRPPRDNDLFFLAQLWGDSNVMKYVGYPHGMKISRAKIAKWINDWQKFGQLRLIIEDPAKNIPIGEIGYREDTKFPFKHRGKVLALDIKIIPEYWGRGIAKKSLKKFIEILSANDKIEYFQVTPNVLNTGAIGLYHSLGFRKIGKIKTWIGQEGFKVKYRYMVLHLKN